MTSGVGQFVAQVDFVAVLLKQLPRPDADRLQSLFRDRGPSSLPLGQIFDFDLRSLADFESMASKKQRLEFTWSFRYYKSILGNALKKRPQLVRSRINETDSRDTRCCTTRSV